MGGKTGNFTPKWKNPSVENVLGKEGVPDTEIVTSLKKVTSTVDKSSPVNQGNNTLFPFKLYFWKCINHDIWMSGTRLPESEA